MYSGKYDEIQKQPRKKDLLAVDTENSADECLPGEELVLDDPAFRPLHLFSECKEPDSMLTRDVLTVVSF